jgi:hypothetical protein
VPAKPWRGRPVGQSPHQNRLAQDLARQAERQGATDIRVNQQQVNANQVHVGRNRPDVQFTYGGKRYYVEYDTSMSTRGAGHRDRILANDPDGIVILVDTP